MRYYCILTAEPLQAEPSENSTPLFLSKNKSTEGKKNAPLLL